MIHDIPCIDAVFTGAGVYAKTVDAVCREAAPPGKRTLRVVEMLLELSRSFSACRLTAPENITGISYISQ